MGNLKKKNGRKMGGQKTRPLSKNGHAQKKKKKANGGQLESHFFWVWALESLDWQRILNLLITLTSFFARGKYLWKPTFPINISPILLFVWLCVSVWVGGAGGIMKFLMGLWKEGGGKHTKKKKWAAGGREKIQKKMKLQKKKWGENGHSPTF